MIIVLHVRAKVSRPEQVPRGTGGQGKPLLSGVIAVMCSREEQEHICYLPGLLKSNGYM
jgi:hypothetical protein